MRTKRKEERRNKLNQRKSRRQERAPGEAGLPTRSLQFQHGCVLAGRSWGLASPSSASPSTQGDAQHGAHFLSRGEAWERLHHLPADTRQGSGRLGVGVSRDQATEPAPGPSPPGSFLLPEPKARPPCSWAHAPCRAPRVGKKGLQESSPQGLQPHPCSELELEARVAPRETGSHTYLHAWDSPQDKAWPRRSEGLFKYSSCSTWLWGRRPGAEPKATSTWCSLARSQTSRLQDCGARPKHLYISRYEQHMYKTCTHMIT